MLILLKNNVINRTFIKDEVYKILLHLIVTGKLKQNEKININDIADELNVSRTPVREAVLMLENDGFIISNANKSTVIAPVDIKQAEEIYPLVFTLEILALKEGFKNIGDQEISLLKKYNNELMNTISSNDFEKFVACDYMFHKIIIDSAKNSELSNILDGLKKKIQRIEFCYYEKVEHKMTSFGGHEKIIESLEKRDLEQSLINLKNNWQDSLESLKAIKNLEK